VYPTIFNKMYGTCTAIVKQIAVTVALEDFFRGTSSITLILLLTLPGFVTSLAKCHEYGSPSFCTPPNHPTCQNNTQNISRPKRH
jgi:hypothetical protein